MVRPPAPGRARPPTPCRATIGSMCRVVRGAACRSLLSKCWAAENNNGSNLNAVMRAQGKHLAEHTSTLVIWPHFRIFLKIDCPLFSQARQRGAAAGRAVAGRSAQFGSARTASKQPFRTGEPQCNNVHTTGLVRPELESGR